MNYEPELFFIHIKHSMIHIISLFNDANSKSFKATDRFVSKPLLLTEEKKQLIQYPKNPTANIPSSISSLLYAAEINYLHYENEPIEYDVDNLMDEYYVWAINQTDDCSWTDEHEPFISCCVKFAKDTNYSFKSINDSSKNIQLKDFELLDIKNIGNVQDALNKYPILYSNIYYRDIDNDVQELENFECSEGSSGQNCQLVSINGPANSSCLIVGLGERKKDTETTYYSEILHPSSQFTMISNQSTCQRCYKFQLSIATLSSVNSVINQNVSMNYGEGNDMTVDFNFRHLYSVVYGLDFGFSSENTPTNATTNEPTDGPNDDDGDDEEKSKDVELTDKKQKNVGVIVGCTVGSVCLVLGGVAIYFIFKKYNICNKSNSNVPV